MAGFLHDDVLDAALAVLRTNVTHLYICSTVPTTYTEASSTYACGVKATPTLGVIDDDGTGRKTTIAAITDGSVTATATATHWALTSGSTLYATQVLSADQAVTSGNVFTLAAFAVTMPAAT